LLFYRFFSLLCMKGFYSLTVAHKTRSPSPLSGWTVSSMKLPK